MEKLSYILVPVDGSAGSAKAVKLAATLALATNANLMILHVSYFDSNTDSDESSWLPDSIAGSVGSEEQSALAGARKLLPPQIAVSYHTRTGIPADEIIAFAEANQVDLIVVGGRGLGIVEGFLLGSVSQEVVERATVTTLVAK